MKENIAVFESWNVRRLYDEETETWYFSVVDIVQILTESPNAVAYWRKLKQRLKSEGNETVTNCHGLKLTARDGKKRLTDVAGAETILRLVQSIPSQKAEPIKLWLARVGYERVQEMEDPEAGIARAHEIWRKQGRSREWIKQRLQSIDVRNALTDYWKDHGICDPRDFAALTGISHKEWSGMTPSEHKRLKRIKKPEFARSYE